VTRWHGNQRTSSKQSRRDQSRLSVIDPSLIDRGWSDNRLEGRRHSYGALSTDGLSQAPSPSGEGWGEEEGVGEALGATHMLNFHPRYWADDRRVRGHPNAPSEICGWPQMYFADDAEWMSG